MTSTACSGTPATNPASSPSTRRTRRSKACCTRFEDVSHRNRGIRFAGTLPPLTCALFIANWDTSDAPLPFGDRASMAAEVLTLRPGHNWAPPTAIHDVAWAMRRHVFRLDEVDAVLGSLPDGAVEFWDPEVRP